MYEVEGVLRKGLDPVGRYCKHCKDRYYNHADVESVRKYKACVFCIKENRELADLKD